MKLRYPLFALTALSLCGSVQAAAQDDLRATYEGVGNGFSMVIEIQQDGDLRGETAGQPMWLLKANGVNYFVVPSPRGDRVLDTRIMSEVMREAIPPELAEILDSVSVDPIELASAGPVTVNGREGEGYRIASAPEQSAVPFVISDDPELALLGTAMVAQFSASAALNPITPDGMAKPILDMLSSGAPIRFAGMDLSEVEHVTLPDERFALPSAPLDKKATRALMVERGMLPEGGVMELPELPPRED